MQDDACPLDSQHPVEQRGLYRLRPEAVVSHGPYGASEKLTASIFRVTYSGRSLTMLRTNTVPQSSRQSTASMFKVISLGELLQIFR